MCRLYGFRASEPTKVECTLVYAQNALLTQSWSDRRGMQHADGWGIGYYDDGEPVLIRKETAAFDDAHFSLAASRAYSRTVLAHVRLATVGGSSIENTHPFGYGPWLFAHNGTVRGFAQLSARLDAETDTDLIATRRGTTDSETAFGWLLTRMRHAGIPLEERSGDLPLLTRVLSDAVTELAGRCEAVDREKPPRLNFVLTDGRLLLATCWNNSLHWVERNGVHDCEICGIPHVDHQPGVPYRAVVLASEPTSREPWRELDNQSMIVVDPDMDTRVERLTR